MFVRVREGSRRRQTPHLLAERQEAAGTSNSLLFKHEVVDSNLKNTFQANATYICSWQLLNLPWRPDSGTENKKSFIFYFIGKSISLLGSSPYRDCTSELIEGLWIHLESFSLKLKIFTKFCVLNPYDLLLVHLNVFKNFQLKICLTLLSFRAVCLYWLQWYRDLNSH